MTRDKFIERWTGIGGNVEDQIARDKMRDDLNKVIVGCLSDISLFELELPTDDEIREMMTTEHYHWEKGRYRRVRLDRIQGAKIMRDLVAERLQALTSKT